jgi:hypothetical protein
MAAIFSTRLIVGEIVALTRVATGATAIRMIGTAMITAVKTVAATAMTDKTLPG